ncbi:CLUMA_CG013073, isoform A [Clunio marinus]|uniref:CLUMA_CG013073, isoform A n=1 Tax=Clunio marinus TaxID=568069 RepID=A0A1J1IHI5_9DIPT|nr:CLUMA_CG013073, isoform A [Clunio marinus]
MNFSGIRKFKSFMDFKKNNQKFPLSPKKKHFQSFMNPIYNEAYVMNRKSQFTQKLIRFEEQIDRDG